MESRCVIDVDELPDQDDEDVTEPWTGTKRFKMPSPGDSGYTATDDIEEDEEIDAWDDKKLSKKIAGLRRRMHESSPENDWAEFDEKQQTELNQRLALCRIRAHEEQYRCLDDATLLKLFPPDILESNLYFRAYEAEFDWFFDPEYCKLENVEDYQRLVLHVTAEFEALEICPYARHTLEDDQQFVQFWETLSRQTELIEKYITGKSCERKRIENMLLYHALKIAGKLPSVYKTPVVARFIEFMLGVEADYTYAGFLTKMWQLLAKKQMNFEDALMCMYNEGKYWSIFCWGDDFKPNLSPIERIYKPHLDRIVEKAQDGAAAHQLVMDTIVENFWKARSYYDYVRKKMRIAEEIGLIPKQPPHRLYTPDSVIKIAGSAET